MYGIRIVIPGPASQRLLNVCHAKKVRVGKLAAKLLLQFLVEAEAANGGPLPERPTRTPLPATALVPTELADPPHVERHFGAPCLTIGTYAGRGRSLVTGG